MPQKKGGKRPGLGREGKFLVGVDIHNASKKVQLKELEVNNLPASIHAVAE